MGPPDLELKVLPPERGRRASLTLASNCSSCCCCCCLHTAGAVVGAVVGSSLPSSGKGSKRPVLVAYWSSVAVVTILAAVFALGAWTGSGAGDDFLILVVLALFLLPAALLVGAVPALLTALAQTGDDRAAGLGALARTVGFALAGFASGTVVMILAWAALG